MLRGGFIHFDLVAANKLSYHSLEISKQIGDIEGLMLVLTNVFANYIDLGEFNTAEDEIVEFVQSTTTPHHRLERFLRLNRPKIFSSRGEWQNALENLIKLRNDEKFSNNEYEVSGLSLDFVSNILELDNFGYQVDFDEAERAMLENIESLPSAWLSRFFLVRVYIRQKRIDEAYDYYAQSKLLLNNSKSNIFIRSTEYIRSLVDFEFAYANGCWQDAVEVCESWIVISQKGGYKSDLARRLIDLGDALIGRNEPGDMERARETYQQSLDMFTEMGAPGYVKVLEERLGDL